MAKSSPRPASLISGPLTAKGTRRTVSSVGRRAIVQQVATGRRGAPSFIFASSSPSFPGQAMATSATQKVVPVDILASAPRAPDEDRFIVQSPYVEPAHQLDLNTLDHENETLAKALNRLRAVRDDYATAPYVDSFNWAEVMSEVRRMADSSKRAFRETTFYIVAFRSQIKPSTEYSQLGELDKAAHAEAVASGGFLK